MSIQTEDAGVVDQLVVVGASAGGVEALSALLSNLPAELPAAVVVAQHIDPAQPSHLQEILQRRTRLRVKTVAEQERLAAGVVYVVPADRHVRVTDHEVSLFTNSGPRPKPSVDQLLTTAAEAFGERLVAVILSGTGSDGAQGAEAVKRAGGTVIIQNPQTAQYAGMPRSLSPTVVDIVAELEDIGPIISKLLAGTYEASPSDEDELRSFLEELRVRCGIDFNSYRTPTILRRLQRRFAATGTSNLMDYRAYLEAHPDEANELIRTFLIKVTEFFRDEELFDYLRSQLLPQLVLEARTSGQLRVWSAGCATGQEAYSLAILIAELLGDELERLPVRIFATDLDTDAIEFARRAVYPRAAVDQLPRDLVERYFTEADGECEVKKSIRSLVIFGEHDLGQRAPFPAIDLILCRNVLMYFTPELQRRALQLFAFSLRQGGCLILGKAESLTPLPQFFTPAYQRLRVYRRHGDRTLIPASLVTAAPPPRQLPSPSASAQAPATRPARPEQRTQPETNLDRLPVGVVVIDRRYDIQSINQAARRLLDIHVPAEGEDLLHLLRVVDPGALRPAIDAAFRTSQPSRVAGIAVPEPISGATRYLAVACHPGEDGPEAGGPATVTLIISDDTAERQTERGESVTTAELEQDVAQLQERLHLLADSNAELREANERLLRTNRELLVEKEALALDCAAIQSSAEEVETLNEELQATNEELETLNEELQATIEELHATNEDLAARSIEVQQLSREYDAQRRRLEQTLSSIGDAVLVVNERGETILANPVYEQLFGQGGQLAAQLPDGQPLVPEEMPRQRAARGESFTMEFVTTLPDGNQRCFEAICRPVQGEGEAQAILVIRDITERSLRQLQDEFLAVAGHELRTPLTSLAGFLQLMQGRLDSGGDTEQLRSMLPIVIRQSRRLARLIEELVDAERLRTGRLQLNRQPVDLRRIVERAVEEARPLTQGQTIRQELGADPLTVEADAARLNQVLLNLINNAVTHAPTSQYIDVRVRRVNGQGEVQVQDYGAGIPAAELPRVFARFYQGPRGQAREGLGLGLYIAHEIVTAHGGTIDVASQEGDGTTFTVRLPLLEDGESV